MALDPTAPADPAAGMAPPAPAEDESSDVVVTICKSGDGGYTVYAGDEPDAGGGDAGAMGAAGGAPAAQGQPADSVGAALKAAMDILQADASSAGAPGSSEDQFQAGFGGADQGSAPGGPAQKY